MQQDHVEREYAELQAKIANLEAKNAKLESTLYKIYLGGYPCPESAEEMVNKADQERIRLKQELVAWQQCAQHQNNLIERLQSILPWDVIKLQDRPPDPHNELPIGDKWRDVEWANTHIGVSIFFRNSGRDHTEYHIATGIFDGSLEQAVNEVTEQVAFAMNRMPTPADLGNQYLAGITMKQMLLIFRELSYYCYITPKLFKEKRLEIFNRIESTIHLSDEGAGRQEKMDWFYRLVKNTFKKYENRRKKFVFRKGQF